MLINSIIFWIFFIVFVVPYFTIFKRSVKFQNVWLLVASYIFYGWTDWRMVSLLIVSTIVYYLLPMMKNKRLAAQLGVLGGVGMLLYFKYVNFFITQFSELISYFGLHANISTFNIIMPIGISFFTFKLISYVIEVCRGNINVEHDFISFAVYVAFFPTIMSGPIDRPNALLSQLHNSRLCEYSNILEGFKRILWGFFLKMCIADKIAPYTDAVFGNYNYHSGVTIMLAAVLYTFQIYSDFCGYSEMAIGTARIMGIKVMENFKMPLFATNPGDFWRKWHISLMTFFKEYVYIPLGGSRCSNLRVFRNTMVTFMVSGLWHGANWTFVIWGGYHGVLVYIYRRIKIYIPHNLSRITRHIYKYVSILVMFVFCTIGWMLFRCDTFQQFFLMLNRVATPGGIFFSWALTALLPISIMLFKELKDEEGWDIHLLHSKSYLIQAVSISMLIVYVFYTGELNGAQFIYFQF